MGGSIIGESTCVNLVKLLAKTKTFFEAFDFGINGDNRNVDMTVGDIYGESIKNVLSSDIIASSLGKANKHIRKNDNKNTNEKSYSDVVRSICIMVAVNTAQLSSLYCQIEKLQKIVLVTSLLRNETFFALIQVI